MKTDSVEAEIAQHQCEPHDILARGGKDDERIALQLIYQVDKIAVLKVTKELEVRDELRYSERQGKKRTLCFCGTKK